MADDGSTTTAAGDDASSPLLQPTLPTVSSGSVAHAADGTITWTPDPAVSYSDQACIENGVTRKLSETELAALHPPVSLDQARAAKAASVQAEAGAVLAQGFSYQGVHVALDDGSRVNINACATEAMLCQAGDDTWPDAFAKGFPTLEGGRLALPTAAAGLTFARAAGAYYAAASQHANDLAEAVGAAGDVSALAAIDPTAGWPANTSTAPTS